MRLSLDAAEPWRGERADGLQTARRQNLWVAFHGWLDYGGPLRTPASNPSNRSLSEADVILDGFEHLGAAVFKQLRGAFMLAVGDATAREVFIVRDALGIHPVFHTSASGRLEFSESTKTLRLIPGARRGFNRAALADHLCHRWPDREETFFAAIHRVPPGSLVRVTSSGIRTERYWDPAPVAEPIPWIDDGPERFDAAFSTAVDRCLQHGPAGIFLSGGLDSISVAAKAADLARDRRGCPPRALSIAMGDSACDERRTQSAIAAGLGLPLTMVEFSEAIGDDGLAGAAATLGEGLSSPLLNTWAPAYLHLASIGNEAGVRTVLSGSGGDEWLTVSPYLSADLIARGDAGDWWAFFQAFRRSYRHSPRRHVTLAAWTFGLRPLASRFASRAFGMAWESSRARRAVARDPAWVAPDRHLKAAIHSRAAGSLEAADPPQGFYAREVRTGLVHPLTSWELEEQYEFGQRTGQRFLHPYWDPDLVDVLYRTPPRDLSAGGRAKSLVRTSMAKRFPGAGLETQKKVSGTNFYRTLLEQSLPQAAAGIGECRHLAAMGIITDAAAREYAAAGFGNAAQRWDLVNLETWVRANA